MSLQKPSLNMLLCTGVLSVSLPVAAANAESGRSIALVLDASGSMKARLPDGTSRMDAAKAAVEELVATLPAEARLSFRAYGHQSPQSAKDCQDTALLAPFDAVTANKTAIVEQANALKPLGYTPITYSLTQAAQDLTAEEADSHTVVLVSDGEETCDSDPCAAAKELAETDSKLVVHTIGAGVDTATRAQLQCIADAARGSYFDANSAQELVTLVSRAAVAEAKPEVMPQRPETPISTTKASKDQSDPAPIEAGEIIKGRLGESGKTGTYHYWKVQAPAGKYRIVLDLKLSDDTSGNLQGEVIAFRPDGSQLGPVLNTNEIDFRMRAAAEIESDAQPDMVLRVGNDDSIVDYWLGLFPVGSDIVSPYFVQTPPIEPLEFGKPFSASLNPKPGAPAEAWYSAQLEAQDYRISAEFRRTDGQKSNVQGSVEMFGPIGQRLKEIEDKVCTVNEIDIAAKCVAKLVLAEDVEVLFRLAPSNEAGYKTIFTVEPF